MNTQRWPDFKFATCRFAASLFMLLTIPNGAFAQQPNPDGVAPITITLQDALSRAQKNEPQYRAALTQYGVAREIRVQSRATLLPNVNYDAAFIYTQGDGVGLGRYIANNGVHEYTSEGNVHQELSWQAFAEYRRAQAQEALARAQSEIAARGLVVTVTQAYYGTVVAQRKFAIAQRAATEAQTFFDITGKLERGGEVAHSDTIKAQLQFQQQQRAVQDAQLEMDRSRLELAVLIFIDANQFAATGINHTITPPLRLPNLGYEASATLQIPIWNWGSSRSKVKVAQLERDQAKVELSFAQRKMAADLKDFFSQAQTTRSELESLRQSAELAAESLRLISLRYQAGEATVLEVVDSQNTLTQAQNALGDGQVRYRTAVASLQTLTGKF